MYKRCMKTKKTKAKLKTKPTTKKKPKVKARQYHLAVRYWDVDTEANRQEVFTFRSEKQRAGMIKVLDRNNTPWAISDSSEIG